MSRMTRQVIKEMEVLPLEMQREVVDFAQFLKSKLKSEKCMGEIEPNGTAMAKLMEEASKKNLFSHIKDPVEWQKEIRKDQPLAGREV